MIQIFLHRDARTERATSIERSWLNPSAGVVLWVDLAAPSIPESLILSDTFGFHPLSVEDAMGPRQFPKVEAYDRYLYAILHGIVAEPGERAAATRQVDFFVGSHYLVTVHDGHSRSIAELAEYAERDARFLGEGPIALFHRIADAMTKHYLPEIEKLEADVDRLDAEAFEQSDPAVIRRIVEARRATTAIRRVALPQRDVVSRLARREFLDVSTEMAFRFRDVYDQLVRVVDDAGALGDRLSDLLMASVGLSAARRRWI